MSSASNRAATLWRMKRVMLDEVPYIVLDEIGGNYDDTLLLLIEAVMNGDLGAEIKHSIEPYSGTIAAAVEASETSLATADLAKWLGSLRTNDISRESKELAENAPSAKIEDETVAPDIDQKPSQSSQQDSEDQSNWINRNKVIQFFLVESDYDENFKFWDNKISRPPKWLIDARKFTGWRGVSSLWDPLLVAHCLLGHESMSLAQLDRVMQKSFPELEERWKEATIDVRC